MRLKALLKHHIATHRFAIILFFAIYLVCTLLGSGATGALSIHFAEDPAIVTEAMGENNFTFSLLSFLIFTMVATIISARTDTKFLITRSVARKEIFAAKALFMLPLAAVLGAFQLITIYADSFVRYLVFDKWLGLRTDLQHIQAPDMLNPLMFFLVSTSMLFAFGAFAYLLGSLLTRWQKQTIIGVAIIAISLIAVCSVFNPMTVFMKIADIFKFLFSDKTTGLIIVAKQLGITIVLFALAFPVARRIIAAK